MAGKRRFIILLIERLRKNADRRGFPLLLALVVGIASGAAGSFIRAAAEAVYPLSGHLKDIGMGAAAFLLPAAGMIFSYFIKKRLSGSDSSGDMLLLIRAARKRAPDMIRLETASHVIAAPVCIGLGASAGMTTPSVLSGGAIGSGVGRILRLAPEQRLNLMICGVTSGMAAVFGAPVSGVVFALEVLKPQLRSSVITPLLFSAAAAAAVSRTVFGDSPFLGMRSETWNAEHLPLYALLGVIASAAGLFSIYFNRTMTLALKKHPVSDAARVAAGALAVSAAVYFLPQLSGEGMLQIQYLIKEHAPEGISAADGREGMFGCLFLIPSLMLLLAGLKLAVTSATLACGGSGGFFAPLLYIGAFTGSAFYSAAGYFPSLELHPNNYIALGICGVFAAGFKAPFTAVMLVVEMSGTYELMIPLMTVSGISYLFASLFTRDSVYAPDV